MLFLSGGCENTLQLTSLEKFALIIAAACHDFKHPGRNTNFLIKCKDRISIAYNDLSPLENMHISETFAVMQNSNNNIMQSMSVQQYAQGPNCLLNALAYSRLTTNLI
jgi:hypothetical protein